MLLKVLNKKVKILVLLELAFCREVDNKCLHQGSVDGGHRLNAAHHLCCNKVLLEHSHALLFMHCLWLLSYYIGRVEQL